VKVVRIQEEEETVGMDSNWMFSPPCHYSMTGVVISSYRLVKLPRSRGCVLEGNREIGSVGTIGVGIRKQGVETPKDAREKFVYDSSG
jgi:hypothetical protein